MSLCRSVDPALGGGLGLVAGGGVVRAAGKGGQRMLVGFVHAIARSHHLQRNQHEFALLGGWQAIDMGAQGSFGLLGTGANGLVGEHRICPLLGSN